MGPFDEFDEYDFGNDPYDHDDVYGDIYDYPPDNAPPEPDDYESRWFEDDTYDEGDYEDDYDYENDEGEE